MASGFVKIAMDEFYSHNPNNLTGLIQRYWMMVEDEVAGNCNYFTSFYFMFHFIFSPLHRTFWATCHLCSPFPNRTSSIQSLHLHRARVRVQARCAYANKRVHTHELFAIFRLFLLLLLLLLLHLQGCY